MHHVVLRVKIRKRRPCSPNFQKIVRIHEFCIIFAILIQVFLAISNLASISLIGRFHIADREFSNGIPGLEVKL